MFCKNCGNELLPEALFCTKCGYNKGSGRGFCASCGGHLPKEPAICPLCNIPEPPLEERASDSAEQKSRFIAGLLGLLIGCWGAHNFYLGNVSKAIVQLLLGTVGILLSCGLSLLVTCIWGLIEAICILCEKINTDGHGIPLKQ